METSEETQFKKSQMILFGKETGALRCLFHPRLSHS